MRQELEYIDEITQEMQHNDQHDKDLSHAHNHRDKNERMLLISRPRIRAGCSYCSLAEVYKEG